MNFLSTWWRTLASWRHFLWIDSGTNKFPARCKNPEEMSSIFRWLPTLDDVLWFCKQKKIKAKIKLLIRNEVIQWKGTYCSNKKKNPSKIAKKLNCNLLAAIPPFDPIIHWLLGVLWHKAWKGESLWNHNSLTTRKHTH
jgi:hypothetical protein